MAKKKRVTYHVLHHILADGWSLKQEGADRSSAVTATKAEAIKRARELAKRRKPSRVIVHKKDGTIQTEWTYGDDPPSKG